LSLGGLLETTLKVKFGSNYLSVSNYRLLTSVETTVLKIECRSCPAQQWL